MSALRIMVVAKIRDSANRVVKYTIRDEVGHTMDVSADALKQKIRCGQVDCVNMTLTSDNRLVDSGKRLNTSNAAPASTVNKASKPVSGTNNTPIAPKSKIAEPTQAQAVTASTKQDQPNANANDNLPDNTDITVSQLRELIAMGKEEDTISFETGSSQTKSVDAIIKKATIMNKVLKKVSDTVYFIDFGQNRKIVVARAKQLTLIDG